jgi:valyl-tRNA synthetase
MVMTGMKFMHETPFHDTFITGTVLDKQGQRMSKTKMNGIDPLGVFDKYGVDATRLVLASIGSTDTRWNDNQVEAYRNFANKIWNAARFCLMNGDGASVGQGFDAPREEWALHDRWIMSRLHQTARVVNDAINAYQFHEAVQTLYHFFWDDFCDWYIELSKQEVSAEAASAARDAARSRLITVLEQALRLLHPFMPYITEELWQRLPGVDEKLLHPAYRGVTSPTIMLAEYPQAEERLIDERAETAMQAVINLISRVRNIRTEMNIKPSERVRLIIAAPDEGSRSVFEASRASIARLARTSEILIRERLEAPRASARAVLAGGAEVAVPLEGLIDFETERARLQREMEKLQKESAKLEAQLSNPQFVERAPAEKVSEIRERLEDITERSRRLTETLEAIK